MPSSPPLFPLAAPGRRGGQEQEKRIEEDLEPGGIKSALRARTRKRARAWYRAPRKRGPVPVGWDTYAAPPYGLPAPALPSLSLLSLSLSLHRSSAMERSFVENVAERRGREDSYRIRSRRRRRGGDYGSKGGAGCRIRGRCRFSSPAGPVFANTYTFWACLEILLAWKGRR